MTAEQSSSNKSAWLWFFVWLTIIIVMLISSTARPFFWIALPGTVTFFAKAMNLLDPNRPEDQEW